MKKNLWVTACLSIVVLCLVTYITLWYLGQNTQEITIKNSDHTQYTVAYYSSVNGQWIDGDSSLKTHNDNKASLRNHSPINSASYQIAIGNRLGKFTCVVDIIQPALGQKARFIDHQGNCHTESYSDGSLALVVGKQHSKPNSVPRWQ